MKAFLVGVTAVALGLALAGMARGANDPGRFGPRAFDRGGFRKSLAEQGNVWPPPRADVRRFDWEQFRRFDQDDFRRLERNDFRRFDRRFEMPRPHHQGPRHGSS